MDNILNGIGTILLCDESKFYTKNGDYEDAIYYFAVSIEKEAVPKVSQDIKDTFVTHRVKSNIYHSTSLFRESRPREKLMDDLTKIIIQNRLKCFCYKYSNSMFFEPTKHLKKFNNSIIKFDKAEFQALFYFLKTLNTYLSRVKPNLLRKEISLYFDRNVYGIKHVEAFTFSSKDFVLKQMTFTEKSQIGLLFIPDFFGYIFRKSKSSQNKAQFGNKEIETSSLIINSYKSLLEITNSQLFTFLDVGIIF